MLEAYFQRLQEGQERRKTLIDLRKALKDSGRQALFSPEQKEILRGLLGDPDPKTRKNAALILGEAGDQDSLEALLEAYEREETLFIRADYLEALGHLSYAPYLGRLKNRMLERMAGKAEEEAKKHRSEEIRALRRLILAVEEPKKHRFTGWKVSSDLILTVSPGLEQLTKDQLPDALQETAKLFSGGVGVLTEDLEPLRGIRTVRDILFRFCRNPLTGSQPEELARAIAFSGLHSYLQERHEGEDPFYFRIDLRSRQEAGEMGRFLARMAAAIEEMTDYKLQNDPSHYECEIRITQNRSGRYYAYLRLPTLPDRRFSYRKKALATSLHPVRAAEVMVLVREDLTEYGIVLDPMCGTGTLLIERSKAGKTRSLYGVDIYGEAVEAGRINAAAANVPIYFVNRDLADFRHDYRFDEILTQFPKRSEKTDGEALASLYRTFVRRIPDWGKEGTVVIVLTTDPGILKRTAAASGYLQPLKEHILSEKTGETLLLYRYRK